MSNVSLGYRNLTDTASLSATNAVSSLPVSNLQDHQISVVFRTSADNTTIDLVAGSQVTRDQIALIGTTLTTNATIRVQLSNTSAGGTDVYDSGTLSLSVDELYKTGFFELPSSQTAQYWRLVVTDTSLGSFDIGRLAVVKALRLSINATYPLRVTYRDTGTVQRTIGGQSIRYQRGRLREINLSYTALGEGDWFDLQRLIDAEIGQTGDVLFVADSDNTTYLHELLVWSEIVNLGPGALTDFNWREKSYTLREIA